MRVTIGERLGLQVVKAHVQLPPKIESVEIDHVISSKEPDVRLSSCPSSSIPWGDPLVREDDGGPSRVRGEMVWLKKDVSILRIEGHRDLTPNEFSDNRRR